MRKVEKMTQHPPTCLHCGRGNTLGPDGEQTPALDLQRDVNWGDSTYLCSACVDVAALIFGYKTAEDVQQVEELNQLLQQQLHDLKAERDLKQRRIETILAGREAERAEGAAA